MNPKKAYKRGYPVAILAGLDETHAALWKVFSRVIKPEKTLTIDGTRNSPKALYNFHEAIINALRPALKESVRSIIVASPPRTNYAQEFIDHVRQHHLWLSQGPSKATFSEITGNASTQSQVAALIKTREFHELISQTTSEETENLLDLLEKRLTTSNRGDAVLFSLEEAEALIFKHPKTSAPEAEYLLLTDKYFADARQKNRLHRLMQIAANRKVKTRVVSVESPAGVRLAQLGGLVCITKPK